MGSFWQWLEDFWGKIQIPSLWLNLLDVVLIAFLFYVLFVLIKRTRALQLFQGLAIALIVMLIASLAAGALSLITLEWLLRTIVTMFVGTLPLVLAVIFQPELRHFLAQIGRGRFRSPLGKQKDWIDEICTAVASMSQKRIGALIILERKSGLAELVAQGVLMDALLTSEALQAIFFPKSPLHDGAVLIHGNRIEAARVMIPMDEVANLPKDLGSRHLAALSVTRDSDAIVVVVSEQSGAISVAAGGQLQRNVSIPELRNRLVKDYTFVGRVR